MQSLFSNTIWSHRCYLSSEIKQNSVLWRSSKQSLLWDKNEIDLVVFCCHVALFSRILFLLSFPQQWFIKPFYHTSWSFLRFSKANIGINSLLYSISMPTNYPAARRSVIFSGFLSSVSLSKNTWSKHSCLYQHITQSPVGLVTQPSQSVTMNGTPVTSV